MIIVIVKYFLPFSVTEKTDTINAASEISNPNTEKVPGTRLGARANNANAIASQPAAMLILTTPTTSSAAPLFGIGWSALLGVGQSDEVDHSVEISGGSRDLELTLEKIVVELGITMLGRV